jgi:protein-ribulosamine 3-kinase
VSTPPQWTAIVASVEAATGERFPLSACTPLSGGCINQGYILAAGTRRVFVKTNTAQRLDMFEAEAEGLRAIRATRSVRAPEPLCMGRDATRSWLALEYLELTSCGTAGMAALGQGLAAMHRSLGERFGWHRDNTIGATPQLNGPAGDWIEFWREQRLGYQLALAARGGHAGGLQRRGEQLLQNLAALFNGYRPQPSLLHGDLWAGNAACCGADAPVIFDPACYHGDREADVAMTELFGGFSVQFYASYRATWPLDAGYAVRRDLYNLYHVLNHLNLFGGGYRSQAERMIDRLLAELGA